MTDGDGPGRLRVLLSFLRPQDALAAGGPMIGPIVLLAILTAVGTAAMLAQWLVLGRVGENVVCDARTVLVRRFFRGRVRDVAAHPAGELVSRATSDALLRRDAT